METRKIMFKIVNKDTRATSIDVFGIVLVSLLLKVYDFNNLVVSSITCQFNVSKITHWNTV